MLKKNVMVKKGNDRIKNETKIERTRNNKTRGTYENE
jgi:hypothetical protein